MQKFNIDENILNDSFTKYENEYFIEINKEEAYGYGVSYHYNHYYPEESPVGFSFMEHRVSRAAFAVSEDKSINQAVLYLEIFDIDLFYQNLVDRYGEPGTTSVSRFYLEQHGFKTPVETKDFNERVYDSLPLPKISDYKNLRNVTWYEVNDSLNRIETNLIVRNQLTSDILGSSTHQVEVTFRK